MIASLAELASANALRALFQKAISIRLTRHSALTAVLALTLVRLALYLLQSSKVSDLY